MPPVENCCGAEKLKRLGLEGLILAWFGELLEKNVGREMVLHYYDRKRGVNVVVKATK